MSDHNTVLEQTLKHVTQSHRSREMHQLMREEVCDGVHNAGMLSDGADDPAAYQALADAAATISMPTYPPPPQ